MGTKTDDAAGAKGAAETEEATEEGGPEDAVGTGTDKGADLAKDATSGAAAEAETEASNEAEAEAEAEADVEGEGDAELDAAPAAPAKSTGVGQGAAAVVSVALGVIGLSGGWLGTIASAKETLVGNMESQQGSASLATTIQAVYGDAWKATALVAGVFALAALVSGFLVLVKPLFGAPGQEQATWIKSVAWAGVALGVIGLILAVAKYSNLLITLPSAPS
ncbi:hypothetical protein AB0B50_12405 [Streptomyces sp. NPDC041068]|uniref:hypothetical protein n=1 Tax=Streptomyces sp. NPDC041068 TaxID=3155130 RepID=UPI0033DDE2A1